MQPQRNIVFIISRLSGKYILSFFFFFHVENEWYGVFFKDKILQAM